MVEGDKQNP